MPKKKSKRKHPRIPFKGLVSLNFEGQIYNECSAQNLSMIGMWITGCREQPHGSRCDIEFQDAGKTADRSLRLKGEVVRTDDNGLAVLFINMNMRAYQDLEGLIIKHAGDCMPTEDDFLNELSEG